MKREARKMVTFDAQSAQCIQQRVAGSPHNAYKDQFGAICLVSEAKTPGGGAPLNENALIWLRAQPGKKYIRLKNNISGFDTTKPLEELPDKEMRDGPYGRYAFYDAGDFGGGPPFPPGPDDDEPPM